MSTFRMTVTVDRPVAEVRAGSMNPDHRDRWISGLKNVETVEVEPGTVDSRCRLLFEERGREVEMVHTVTRVDPEREHAFDLELDGMSGHVSVRFDARGTATDIRTENDFRPRSLPWKLMLPLSRSDLAKRQAGAFRKLGALIETEAP